MIRNILCAATFVFAAFPVFAQGSPDSTSGTGGLAGPTAASAPHMRTARVDQNKKIICKVTSETGTRLMGNRICLTEADWAIRDEQTREAVVNADHHVQ